MRVSVWEGEYVWVWEWESICLWEQELREATGALQAEDLPLQCVALLGTSLYFRGGHCGGATGCPWEEAVENDPAPGPLGHWQVLTAPLLRSKFPSTQMSHTGSVSMNCVPWRTGWLRQPAVLRACPAILGTQLVPVPAVVCPVELANS